MAEISDERLEELKGLITKGVLMSHADVERYKELRLRLLLPLIAAARREAKLREAGEAFVAACTTGSPMDFIGNINGACEKMREALKED